MKFRDMAGTYQQLWRNVKVTDLAATNAVVSKILANKQRYEKVQRSSGIWWVVIAIIHNMESSLSFAGHLHNGDPLSARTRNVPTGRPTTGNPPFTWEQSAADALSMKHTDEVDFLDTPEEILWYCERYNGWGYQTGAGKNTTPPRRSPYLWSKTNQWSKGKYVADGRFDPNAGSAQVGVAAILKRLEELGEIRFGSLQQPAPEAVANPTPKEPQPSLKKGDVNAWVGVLQHTLNGCGYGLLEVDDDFGDKTEAAVKKFQQNLGLSATGVVDAATWKALEAHKKTASWTPAIARNPAPKPIAASNSNSGFDRLAFAKFAERELGRNLVWSPSTEARKYTQDYEPVFGRGRFAWCGATVRWCLNNFDGKGGVKLPIGVPGEKYTFALVEEWQRYMITKGFYHDNNGSFRPQPGDLVLYDWNQWGISQPDQDFEDHIGIHLRMEGNLYVAAEGNADHKNYPPGRSGIFKRGAVVIQGWVRLPDGWRF